MYSWWNPDLSTHTHKPLKSTQPQFSLVISSLIHIRVPNSVHPSELFAPNSTVIFPFPFQSLHLDQDTNELEPLLSFSPLSLAIFQQTVNVPVTINSVAVSKVINEVEPLEINGYRVFCHEFLYQGKVKSFAFWDPMCGMASFFLTKTPLMISKQFVTRCFH